MLTSKSDQSMESPVETGTSIVHRKKPKTIVIVVSLVMLLCLCVGIYIATGFIKVALERDDVTLLIDRFMRELENKDVVAAFDMFSTRARRQMELSDVEELIEGDNYLLIDGYESVDVHKLTILKGFNTNPDAPQGTVAEVEAYITYEKDIIGKLTAILEEEDGNWMFYNFELTVHEIEIESQ